MRTGCVRRVFDLTGTVQGVGFRPALYRLAREAGLRGWIRNRSGSVRICLSGKPSAIDLFMQTLPAQLPPNAGLAAVAEVVNCPSHAADRGEFSILDSEADTAPDVVIPADLAVCADCAREVLDPADRRFGYPFTTCTRCGPRYTVVNGMPYDRSRTTLSSFPLCADCRAEYENPADRRFHAEAIACPECGPSLLLLDREGNPAAGNPLRESRRVLSAGGIVAVRGIGGFLLACDATNRAAVAQLRHRKHRPHKPLAVMARSMEVVRRVCIATPECEELLLSPAGPIVIMSLRERHRNGTAASLLSPDSDTLGVMLPTSPLHLLLFEPLPGDPAPRFDILVMTSGNRGGEPICTANEEAVDRLRGIADAFLCHNREINLRNDDSLCVIRSGNPQVWRRARGYSPAPLETARPLGRCVLAMGAEMKNAVALGYGRKVVLSPHVGDLETPEAHDALARVCRELPSFLSRTPQAVAVDMHPDMHSTVLGRLIAEQAGLPVEEVQHHHAHAAAALAEHGLDSGLCLAFDGTGLGPDGTVWGAEMLLVENTACRRLATFAPAPLPGGDAAVRAPARQAIARCWAAGITPGPELLRILGISDEQAGIWKLQCERAINAPLTHAAGRVFDAAAALTGLAPRETTYDGQAAVRMETAAGRATGRAASLPFKSLNIHGLLMVDWAETFVRIVEAAKVGRPVEETALGLHHAVADAAVAMVEYTLSLTPHRAVALSGGVFMNRILNTLLAERLGRLGVDLLLHRLTPPNDGCIAFGQAVTAGWRSG